ncbi:MAG: hypothetical protein COB89_03910 [Piscirickettsiaceae bacterium]|nr:MAG: hypothetical protein COB89_03910 [Piscirickettsiaceae bacterium]
MVRVKIPRPYQLGLFFLVFTSWCSGVTFFVLKTWFFVDGTYGVESHPWQFPTLQFHGASAFLMMICFGLLLGSHIPLSWRIKRKRKSGIALIVIPAFLIITAYLLYYIAEDTSREWVAYAHLAVGFSFPIVLIIHIMTKIRNKK